MDVLGALAASSSGLTSAQLARQCAISTSTCALVLGELERGGWVARYDDRRYGLGSGLFGLVRGLRNQFPLLDQGRAALVNLHESLAAGCSMSRIDDDHLTVIDSVGHASDGEHAGGQRFPIDPPFGLVAMAWRDDAAVDGWLRGVTPRLTRADIDRYRQVLADVRERGYGAWTFDDEHASLHDRVAGILASLRVDHHRGTAVDQPDDDGHPAIHYQHTGKGLASDGIRCTANIWPYRPARPPDRDSHPSPGRPHARSAEHCARECTERTHTGVGAH